VKEIFGYEGSHAVLARLAGKDRKIVFTVSLLTGSDILRNIPKPT
jgi:hypothetical protein